MKNYHKDKPDDSSSPVEFDPLLTVCKLLNEQGADYIIVGAFACILHGLIRTTDDVDILISPETENFRKVIDALSKLPDRAAAELSIQDLQENVVVKIADAVEVDVSKTAWSVTYNDAIRNIEEVLIEGVKIPYLSLPDLIKSKDTPREKDQLDLISLRELLKRKNVKRY